MFIYILFPIKWFVNGYLQKKLIIFRIFFTFFDTTADISARNINQSVNYRTKSYFTRKLFRFDIDFNLYLMYNRIESIICARMRA